MAWTMLTGLYYFVRFLLRLWNSVAQFDAMFAVAKKGLSLVAQLCAIGNTAYAVYRRTHAERAEETGIVIQVGSKTDACDANAGTGLIEIKGKSTIRLLVKKDSTEINITTR